MVIRMRGIKRVRSKGRVYFYHRASKTRLTAPPGSAAFIAEVRALDEAARRETRQQPRTGYLAGSWGELVAAYRAAPEFSRLALRTRSGYDEALAWLAPLDDMPLLQLTPATCLQIRDRAFAQRARHFANYTLRIMSIVLGWGRPRGFIADNPAHGVPKIARPRSAPKANRAWTDEECAAVLAAATGPLRIGIALGMYAGMRGGDVARAAWSSYDGTAIAWRQSKTGEPVWLPAHRELRAILDAAPRRATTMVAGAWGRSWKASTLQRQFRALVRSLEREGKVGPGLTFHGLRSTAGKNLADLGADVRAIMAMLGHRTAAMALHYSSEADRERAAKTAVTFLERRVK